jgi:SAM-dependent methyltransferase
VLLNRACARPASPVAIEKARSRAADLPLQFLVGDVTQLDALKDPFDISFDVGCFHCLDAIRQRRYASEIHRLLKPGRTHLIWALDDAPSDISLTPAVVKAIFVPGFELRESRASRRRIARSHWYWLVRE